MQRKGFCRERRYRAGRRQSRRQTVPTCHRDLKPSPRGAALRPRHAHIVTHCSQAKADGRRRRDKTKTWHARRRANPPRRRDGTNIKENGYPCVGGGEKEGRCNYGGLMLGTAGSSACKASKVAAARRVLVARAYRYIQRRQLFSERQESNQDCRQFMTDKTDDSSWYM